MALTYTVPMRILPNDMGATAGNMASSDDLSRDEVRGRAIGISVLAVFAFGWAGGATTAVSTAVGVAVSGAAALCSLAAIGGALFIFRRSPYAPSEHDQARGQTVGRRFGAIVTLEFVGLFILVRVLGATGQSQLIPVIVCLGVGIHFFPLRRLFQVPLYDLTGVALCLVALVTVVLVPLSGQPALWQILPGFGAALALYGTCAMLFRTTIGHTAGAMPPAPPES